MFRFFENLIDPFQKFREETPPAKLWPYVKSHYGPYYKLMIWMAIMGASVALIETGLIFYSGRVIDLMEVTGPESFWSRNGLELALAALFILFLRPVVIGFSHVLMEQSLVSNLHDQVRFRAHKHMLGQSSNFFQNDFAGRLSNRVMQMGQAVEDATYMVFEALWFSISYVIGAMIILSQTDWRLTVPLSIWVVLYVLYTINVAIRVSVASEKWSDARSLLTGRIVDAYANIETVKLFSAGEREESYVLNALKRHRLRFQRFLRLMTEMSLIQNILNGGLIVGMMGPAVWLWSQGIVTAGEVAAASALTIRLNGMSGWIMWVTIRLFEHAGVIKEGLRSISVPHEVTDVKDAADLDFDKGEIEFRGVSHHYGKGYGGLDQVNLKIAPGQKVGLVGRSGAGKSSLVNLLLRFRDTEQGEILIDGQDVAKVTQDSLRSQIGMVSQDNSLLHRSVRANILFGNPDASEAEMIAATQRAEADTFIAGLEDPKGRTGYDAHVGERGVKLSGGQRQRIALSRVVLKDAPILVLDEATSALDSEVEAAILDTLYGVMEGKTVIAIAHRLSTIARMDRIVVMDQGKVVEDGSHDELLGRGGIYAELWSMQSGGFLG